MLKNLFGKSNTVKIYLADWQVKLNGDTQCDNFICTYITTEETFKNINIGLELVFKESKLAKAYRHEFGEKIERELGDDEVGLSLPNYEPNKISQFIPDPDGLHQLGGEVPDDFQLPPTRGITPFQYLGYINNQDPIFNWLPFKVHLTCPIFLNIENIYLDYSVPNKPTVINAEEVEKFKSNYGSDLHEQTEIVFDEAKFKAVQANAFEYEIGNAGIPPIIHETEIPVCPKSGKRMRFLCQLLGGVDVKRINVTFSEDYYEQYFKTMNFWGDGDLYVFFEPTAKTACYFIQNT